MNSAPFIRWDDDAVLESLGTLERVLNSQYGPGVFRGELRDLRDKLHALCVAMEKDGSAEDDEQLYVSLFDALSYCTEALRGPGVKREMLVKVLHTLRDIRNLQNVN